MCPINKFRMKVSKRRGLCACFAKAQKTDTERMGEMKRRNLASLGRMSRNLGHMYDQFRD